MISPSCQVQNVLFSYLLKLQRFLIFWIWKREKESLLAFLHHSVVLVSAFFKSYSMCLGNLYKQIYTSESQSAGRETRFWLQKSFSFCLQLVVWKTYFFFSFLQFFFIEGKFMVGGEVEKWGVGEGEDIQERASRGLKLSPGLLQLWVSPKRWTKWAGETHRLKSTDQTDWSRFGCVQGILDAPRWKEVEIQKVYMWSIKKSQHSNYDLFIYLFRDTMHLSIWVRPLGSSSSVVLSRSEKSS